MLLIMMMMLQLNNIPPQLSLSHRTSGFQGLRPQSKFSVTLTILFQLLVVRRTLTTMTALSPTGYFSRDYFPLGQKDRKIIIYCKQQQIDDINERIVSLFLVQSKVFILFNVT